MSMKSTSVQPQLEVVYNLYEIDQGLFLPNAFIVTVDKQGMFAHIRQKALAHTIEGFGLTIDAVREKLLQIIDLLQPAALEGKFNTNKRKQLPLNFLMKEAEVKKAILKYVNRNLDEFLSLIAKHSLPLSYDAERKILVHQFIVETGQHFLTPHLTFNKTDGKVLYRLTLSENGDKWLISTKDVTPVCNHPAWVIADYKLFKIDHINGNMVKPFQTKDEVIIPEASVKAYFKTFILKVAEKVDIDAEGFEVVANDTLLGSRVELVRNFFNDQWGLTLQMLYTGVQFNWHEKKEKRTSIEFRNDEVTIVRVSRDIGREAGFVEKFKSFGLENSVGSYFQSGETNQMNGEATTEMIEWLSNNRKNLEKAGFEVKSPLVDGEEIHLHVPSLSMDVKKINDWFDIHAVVRVGDVTFPFSRLGKNIREGNPYFRMKNGKVFVIPKEWMNKYSEFFKFAQHSGEQLKLVKSQFTILEKMGLQARNDQNGKQPLKDFKISKLLKAELRPYQLDGVKWLVELYQNELGACLADDMGLGKTLQTIAMLLHAKENKAYTPKKEKAPGQLDLFKAAADDQFLNPLNALIVLPASLVFNWQEELMRFAPSLTIYRHVGQKRHKDIRLLNRFDVILTTYQTASRDVELLNQQAYEYIVLDESQQIKNRESKVFKALNELTAKHKISLSGTPIENSLSDLWSQMQFINPDLLGSFSFFKKEFIRPIERMQNEEKKDRLRSLVQPYLLRRTKEEVVKDLPPLSTRILYTEMTSEQKKLYEREKSAARNYLLENFDASDGKYRLLVLQTLTKLRQLVNHPVLVKPEYKKDSGKFHEVMEQWEIIQKSGHKVLIFSSFVKYLEMFRAELESRGEAYSWLTGSVTANQREAEVKKFENDESVRSFLISIKAGGVGLNLTAADYVFILDPWWNPTTEQQAIARAHRIGQTKNVFAVKFITRESIEEKILKLQEKKSQLAEDIIGQSEKMAFSKGDIEYLLQ
ncbi:MAG: ATP-dependent helicase [Bacteroidetes bacterium]|nr:MAG: ATP-dependent helicase [Bacteroidota bacterium]